MSIFADQNDLKAMLQEYMRRVVLAKPDDPLSFLLEEISQVRALGKAAAWPSDRVAEALCTREEGRRRHSIDGGKECLP